MEPVQCPWHLKPLTPCHSAPECLHISSNLSNRLIDPERSPVPPSTLRQTDRQTRTHRCASVRAPTASSSSTAASCSRSRRTACSCPAPAAQCRATLPTCPEGDDTCQVLLPPGCLDHLPHPPPGQLVCRLKGSLLALVPSVLSHAPLLHGDQSQHSKMAGPICPHLKLVSFSWLSE